MRQIPNILSMLRILLSVLLLPLIPVQPGFIVVYVLIGLTDVFDGLIARKFGYESEFGAKLDSLADMLFYMILIYIILRLYSPIFRIPHLAVLIAIIGVRLINMVLTKRKYKTVVFVHTLANKLSGLVVYLVPLMIGVVREEMVIWCALVIPLVAAIEEILMTLRYTEPDLNRKSIFQLKRRGA